VASKSSDDANRPPASERICTFFSARFRSEMSVRTVRNPVAVPFQSRAASLTISTTRVPPFTDETASSVVTRRCSAPQVLR
jgi:hypothetical protein